MPDRVGKVDHLTSEDRSQPPVPPPVVGHEPHLGSRSIRPRTGGFIGFGVNFALDIPQACVPMCPWATIEALG